VWLGNGALPALLRGPVGPAGATVSCSPGQAIHALDPVALRQKAGQYQINGK
jgi:hypothetical protein